jgi:hypothetical protein
MANHEAGLGEMVSDLVYASTTGLAPPARGRQ